MIASRRCKVIRPAAAEGRRGRRMLGPASRPVAGAARLDAWKRGAYPDDDDIARTGEQPGYNRMSAPERGAPGTWQHLAWWADGGMALGATQASLVSNDLDAALLLCDERGGGLSYASSSGQWHIWDGRCHRPDDSGEIDKVIIGFATRYRDMLAVARQATWASAQAALPPDASEPARRKAAADAWKGWEAAGKYAAGLMKSSGHSSLLAFLAKLLGKSDEELSERNPGLLNLSSGTLDLARLAQRPHAREDMITYTVGASWDARAWCPRFWDLIWQVSGQDREVAGFMIRALGYSMLGDNREQKIIFLSGPSGSGKSVLLHVVSELLGPLAHRAQSDLICVVRHGRNARTENSVRGKRLVTITETSKFMTIDEGQLKRITGEPVISVDQHYAKTEIRTPVTWTIWVATNDMPSLLNFDAAMRRRVLVIPAGEGLELWEMDPTLATAILSTERDGILALLARGCAEYFRTGLSVPPAVVRETEKYAAEQNTVIGFIADTIAIGGWSPEGGIPQHTAWEVYQQWSRGSSHLTRTEFYKHMREHPAVTYNPGSRRFEGIAWNVDWAARVH